MTGAVVDTSAVLSILFREPSAPAMVELLRARAPRLMSAATRVELGIVVEARLGPSGAEIVARFLRDTAIEIVPVDADNLGACFSYAAAEQHGLPLLCVGADFPATDIDVLTPP